MSVSIVDIEGRKPRLRLLEEIPIDREGETQVCLRDPTGCTRAMVFLPLQVYFIVKHFDGGHTLREIQEIFFRAFSHLVRTDQIAEIADELEKNYFLEGQVFEAYRKGIEEEFRRETVRHPAHAGGCYDADPEGCLAQMESFFLHPDGPGELPPCGPRAEPLRPVRGIVVPHIDLRAGGPCSARAFHALASSALPDVYLVLGTCHAPSKNLFVLSPKDFATPLGTVRGDRELVEAVAARAGARLLEDEILHRQEHSIEFPALFLAYVNRRRGSDVPMVPILCGSFDRQVQAGEDPESDVEVAGLVRAVREALAEQGKRACLVAGADLAHVGVKFGDPSPPSPAFLEHVKEEDLKLLSQVEAVSASGFFREIEKDKDSRRICGFPPIYTMLAILQRGEGRLLRYEQWNDEARPSTVSYGSVVIY